MTSHWVLLAVLSQLPASYAKRVEDHSTLVRGVFGSKRQCQRAIKPFREELLQAQTWASVGVSCVEIADEDFTAAYLMKCFGIGCHLRGER